MSRTLSADAARSLCRLGLRPRDLVLYVTSACNLRCRHCYVGTELLNAAESYDAADVVAFAASFPRLRRVTVLGGEPLLHERINEILAGLVALAIDELRVTTNLTGFFNFDRSRFRPDDLLVAVSLDGHDAATHDAVRGRRRFERTCANISELVEAGWWVEVTHTVMRHNVDHLRHLIELCRRLGVGLLNLHLMSNMGNALQNPDLVVPAERWLEARRMLEGLSDPRGGLRIRYPRFS
ncbi:radical SAM protein [Amycolatopsis sp. NPDC098790]|uniref:radical SAM protein n=1 Tax=Amycolatopsis sp. NPDC098790 TaxID=3363939 RepID=UPI0037F23D2A